MTCSCLLEDGRLNGKCVPFLYLSGQRLWLVWQEDRLETGREDEGEQNQGGDQPNMLLISILTVQFQSHRTQEHILSI